MRGRQILIEPLRNGGHASVLCIDGRIQDLLIDSQNTDQKAPEPESIHLGVIARPMKGIGGVMVNLGSSGHGFLRGQTNYSPGTSLIVQVSGRAEAGKAPPVSDRPILKGRAAILTPGAPGINIARSLRSSEHHAELAQLANAAMQMADNSLGLIIRSSANDIPDEDIQEEIQSLLSTWDRVATTTGSAPGCVLDAPGAADQAWREWSAPGTDLVEGPSALRDAGMWDEIEALLDPRVKCGGGHMYIEPTRAMVAIDVNTGRDLSPAAALKVNMAAARDIPRQLRLRGLGGQITVDFAPLAKKDRRLIETTLSSALREDGIDTTISGWTPLGNLELQRKRSRRPVSDHKRQILNSH